MFTLPCAIMCLYIMIRISFGRCPRVPSPLSIFSHSCDLDCPNACCDDILDVSEVVMIAGCVRVLCNANGMIEFLEVFDDFRVS